MEGLRHRVEHEARDRVLHLVHRAEAAVREPQLLALIDKRRAPAEEGGGGEHRRGLIAIPPRVNAEAAHAARAVVVFQHERVPPGVEILPLRVEQTALERAEIKRLRQELEPRHIVARQMLKVEDAVELARVALDVAVRVLGVGRVALADGVGVVVREDAGVQLLQKFVHPRPVHEEVRPLLQAERIAVAADRLRLGIEIEDVEAKARHALVEPEAQNVLNFFPDFGVLPVQVRLLRREEVEVKLVRLPDALPRRAREAGGPVRRREELSAAPPARADDVIVAVFGFGVLQRRFEPRVLIARVVQNHVHDHADAALFAFFHQPVKVRHRAEGRMNRAVIRHVVAVVLPRGRVEGRKPDRRHAEIPEIIEL